MTVLSVSAEIFACHSAACRPPTSGGTGGSGGGSSASIKGGAVHVDGKAITSKIVKRGGQYWATMSGKHHQFVHSDKTKSQRPVTSKTRKGLVEEAHRLHQEHLATKSIDWAARRANGGSMSQTDRNRVYRLTNLQAQQVRTLGKTSPAKVSIGRDGGVSVNGKKTSVYHVKKSGSVYHIEGVTSRSGEYTKPRVFKSHTAVKSYIAKEVNAHVQFGG